MIKGLVVHHHQSKKTHYSFCRILGKDGAFFNLCMDRSKKAEEDEL